MRNKRIWIKFSLNIKINSKCSFHKSVLFQTRLKIIIKKIIIKWFQRNRYFLEIMEILKATESSHVQAIFVSLKQFLELNINSQNLELLFTIIASVPRSSTKYMIFEILKNAQETSWSLFFQKRIPFVASSL